MSTLASEDEDLDLGGVALEQTTEMSTPTPDKLIDPRLLAAAPLTLHIHTSARYIERPNGTAIGGGIGAHQSAICTTTSIARDDILPPSRTSMRLFPIWMRDKGITSQTAADMYAAQFALTQVRGLLKREKTGRQLPTGVCKVVVHTASAALVRAEGCCQVSKTTARAVGVRRLCGHFEIVGNEIAKRVEFLARNGVEVQFVATIVGDGNDYQLLAEGIATFKSTIARAAVRRLKGEARRAAKALAQSKTEAKMVSRATGTFRLPFRLRKWEDSEAGGVLLDQQCWPVEPSVGK